MRVGLWAAALAALSPALYYYSQEARAYALLILLSAAALVAFQRALAAPRGRSLALWAAMSALALLTHYFAVFLFIPQALILARRLGRRPCGRPPARSCSSGSRCCRWRSRSARTARPTGSKRHRWASASAETVKQFLVGLYGPQEVLTAAAAGLLARAAPWRCSCASRAERERGRRARWRSSPPPRSALPLLLAATHVIDIFDGRNVIAAAVPLAVLVAAGLGAARAPRAGAVIGRALLRGLARRDPGHGPAAGLPAR